MTDFANALNTVSSGMKAQATRLRHISENIANADTPGYRRKTVPFEAVMRGTEVETGRLRFDDAPFAQIFDPSNPLSDATGHYDGSNVDLLIEIADAREAQRSYDANLKMFDQVRQMSSDLMDLLRR